MEELLELALEGLGTGFCGAIGVGVGLLLDEEADQEMEEAGDEEDDGENDDDEEHSGADFVGLGLAGRRGRRGWKGISQREGDSSHGISRPL